MYVKEALPRSKDLGRKREKQIETEYKEREDQKEAEYLDNLKRVVKENKASQGSPNQETKKSNSDVDWSSSAVNSAVFNYFKEEGDYLCVYINEQSAPIKLKNSTWGSKYPAALKNVQTLQKGEIFKYITQGTNMFSPDSWFSKIILMERDSAENQESETYNEISTLETTYILTSQIISDLNNTKYPQYLPQQLKKIEILEQNNIETHTKERRVF